MKVFDDRFWELEGGIKAIRGTRLIELINYIAQIQSSVFVAEITPIPVIPASPMILPAISPVQLSLF
jgi:hypothetical protein